MKLYKPTIKSIKTEVSKLKTNAKKLERLFEHQKELKRVIYALENTHLKKYTKKNKNTEFKKASELVEILEDLEETKEIEDCPELYALVESLHKDFDALFKRSRYYKEYYSKDILDNDIEPDKYDTEIAGGFFDIKERIEKAVKKYKVIENFVDAEIEYIQSVDKAIVKFSKTKRVNTYKNKENYNFDKLIDKKGELNEKLIKNKMEELGDEGSLSYLNRAYEEIKTRDYKKPMQQLFNLMNIRKLLNNTLLDIDLNREPKAGAFNTYDFDEEKIFMYAKSLQEIEMKFNYFLYVKREIDKVLYNLNIFLGPKPEDLKFYGLDEYQIEWDRIFDKYAGLIATDEVGEGIGPEYEEKYLRAYKNQCEYEVHRLKVLRKQIGEEITLIESMRVNDKIKTDNNLEAEKNHVKLQSSNEDIDSKTKKKKITTRKLKALAKEVCEKIIEQKKIITVLKETKADKCISSLVIEEIEKEYNILETNKRSLHYYFRKGELLLKEKNGKIIVEDTYPRKKTN